MPVALAMIQDALVLQIPGRLAPPVFVDDIRKSDAADWLEPAHWVADRQQGIRMDAGRQSESGLSFLLELQVQRRQGRPEAERSRCEQHVLHRRMISWAPGSRLPYLISVAGEWRTL
jgi:hypothetical protein